MQATGAIAILYVFANASRLGSVFQYTRRHALINPTGAPRARRDSGLYGGLAYARLYSIVSE